MPYLKINVLALGYVIPTIRTYSGLSYTERTRKRAAAECFLGAAALVLLIIFSTKQVHWFTKNTIPPAILFKYFVYLCTKLISMEEYLIISNANFLLRVASEQIAYVCSEGSYCNLRLTNGDEYTFSFNLVVFEKKIVEQLAQTAHFFARVGRNYIINSQHIFSINLNTSELVLYNERFCEKFTLHVSKEPLKQLKALLDNSIKS